MKLGINLMVIGVGALALVGCNKTPPPPSPAIMAKAAEYQADARIKIEEFLQELKTVEKDDVQDFMMKHPEEVDLINSEADIMTRFRMQEIIQAKG